jgi:hypothetical protein
MDDLGHFGGGVFPMADTDKDLKTEVFVSGQNNGTDFKKVHKDSD